MTEQYPQLWDAGPVRLISRSHKRGAPPVLKLCAEPGCTKPARRAQGARYCEDHARSIDYELKIKGAPSEERSCARCGKRYIRRNKVRSRSVRAVWDEFCPGCTNDSPLTLATLINHNVPDELARAWLRLGADLRCEFPGCGRRLSSSEPRGKPRIDHAHDCCDSSTSCGACIRGVVCPRCNTTVGYLELLVDNDLLADALNYIKTPANG